MALDQLRGGLRRLDLVTNSAAEVGFYLALTLVPFLGVTIALIGRVLPLDLGQSIEQVLMGVLPPEAHIDAREMFSWARSASSEGWLTVGFLLALVTSFRFMSTCVRLLGSIVSHDARPTLEGWRSLLGSVVLLLLWIAALGTTALFLFVGPFVERGLLMMPEMADFSLSAFSALRALLVLLVLFIVVRFTYRVVAGRPDGRWRLSVAALLTATGWIGVSHLLTMLVPLLWEGTQLYGTLGSVVLLLTWAYLYAWILLAGGLLLVKRTR